LAEVLSDQTGAVIVGYFPTSDSARKYTNQTNKSIQNAVSIYKSFGAIEVVCPSVTPKLQSEAGQMFDVVRKSITTKMELRDLCLDGIEVGYLLYDSFLKEYKQSTVDLSSAEFLQLLLSFIEDYLFWRQFFNVRNVSAINVSHCVYRTAVPMKIALHLEIPAYQVNATHMYRLTPDNQHAYTEGKYFPELFATLAPMQKRTALLQGQKRIARRVSGEIGVDMDYSTKSAFGKSGKERLLKPGNQKPKILIASHCFSDSPHSYGKNLFADFQDWLECIGQIACETDYEWYIKTHPDYLPESREVVRDFVRRYPKVVLLPAEASHRQLITEGIDFCLTVFGSVAIEYAALNIPVITASPNTPTIRYKFNVHPQTIGEYVETLKGLPKLELTIDQKEVYEWYFMQNSYHTNDWLLEDYDGFLKQINSDYKKQFMPIMYDYWTKKYWNPERHERILRIMTGFIESGEYCGNHSHMI